ncbi:helix-turn-helix transcriptional regulator [Amycolatopsis australiensis]|uniref:Helix-turn-helix domain-containing protein n=1 Tax=Amycolatopsis australiensis TaxID=546364 RepID=A0A1K1S389_9PSEU|nr:helix-turn-helix transcriptional regulator [Amycolatopsis australiensis]SFW78642.1 Helix-turn-helix domain-containing protein [Amycolatopsis australiensis]
MTSKQRVADRREQLSEFLRARRARVKPADVGLPEGGRRNTPGLRREEVALLAGVSASWYTWLEQGRNIRVSAAVLDSISSALALDPVDRVHLYNLAEMNPPKIEFSATESERRVLEHFARAVRHPAFIVDKYWDILYANPPAARIIRLDEDSENFLELFFLDRRYRDIYVNWDEVAECFVGSLRIRAGTEPDDAELADLVSRLSRDWTFRSLWKRHSTAHSKARVVTLRTPDEGEQNYDATSLDLSGCDDIHLIGYIPQD